MVCVYMQKDSTSVQWVIAVAHVQTTSGDGDVWLAQHCLYWREQESAASIIHRSLGFQKQGSLKSGKK